MIRLLFAIPYSANNFGLPSGAFNAGDTRRGCARRNGHKGFNRDWTPEIGGWAL